MVDSYFFYIAWHGLVFSWINFYCEFVGTHLHFQLALNPPTTHDMPGVVSVADRSEALLEYIGKIFDAAPEVLRCANSFTDNKPLTDPRFVVGELY